MAKRIFLFFLVISMGYLSTARTHSPLQSPLAEASDSVDSGHDTEDTDFC